MADIQMFQCAELECVTKLFGVFEDGDSLRVIFRGKFDTVLSEDPKRLAEIASKVSLESIILEISRATAFFALKNLIDSALPLESFAVLSENGFLILRLWDTIPFNTTASGANTPCLHVVRLRHLGKLLLHL